MKNYDIIVAGSGGGAKISSPAASMGCKVAVIEKDRLGGTCLNRGCIPSKMLIHPADIVTKIKHAKKFDIQNDTDFAINFANLITRISETVDNDSDKIYTSYSQHPNIDLYEGTAKFVDNKVIEVNGELLTAEKIFIAVGARPYVPSINGLDGTPYMTSTEALRNTKLPKKMIVVGGGYIACELGYAYAALGTNVHFLVRSDHMLRSQDSEVSAEFLKIFSQSHNIHFNALPIHVAYEEGHFTVTYLQEGHKHQITADSLLIATGIASNADTLNLENTDIKTRDRGFIIVDDHLRTAVDGVYSLGDCVGNYFFRHSVNFEGEYLLRTLFTDPSDEPIVYPPVPHAVFTYPQIAGVGKTEDQLKREGVDYIVGLNPYKSSAMGMALLSDHGFCKILLDRHSRRILGAHIIGDEASNMIHMLIAFMNKNGTLDDLLNMIYVHPALPEIVRNAARKAQANFEKLSQFAISQKS